MSKILQIIEKWLRENKKSRILRQLATFMACVIIFTTTYALILPAITIEQDEAINEYGFYLEDAQANLNTDQENPADPVAAADEFCAEALQEGEPQEFLVASEEGEILLEEFIFEEEVYDSASEEEENAAPSESAQEETPEVLEVEDNQNEAKEEELGAEEPQENSDAFEVVDPIEEPEVIGGDYEVEESEAISGDFEVEESETIGGNLGVEEPETSGSDPEPENLVAEELETETQIPETEGTETVNQTPEAETLSKGENTETTDPESESEEAESQDNPENYETENNHAPERNHNIENDNTFADDPEQTTAEEHTNEESPKEIILISQLASTEWKLIFPAGTTIPDGTSFRVREISKDDSAYLEYQKAAYRATGRETKIAELEAQKEKIEEAEMILQEESEEAGMAAYAAPNASINHETEKENETLDGEELLLEEETFFIESNLAEAEISENTILLDEENGEATLKIGDPDGMLADTDPKKEAEPVSVFRVFAVSIFTPDNSPVDAKEARVEVCLKDAKLNLEAYPEKPADVKAEELFAEKQKAEKQTDDAAIGEAPDSTSEEAMDITADAAETDDTTEKSFYLYRNVIKENADPLSYELEAVNDGKAFAEKSAANAEDRTLYLSFMLSELDKLSVLGVEYQQEPVIAESADTSVVQELNAGTDQKNHEGTAQEGSDAEIKTAESTTVPEENIEAFMIVEGEDYTITLAYTAKAEIPEDAMLTAFEIDKTSDEYAQYLAAARAALGLSENEAVPSYAARFFDITILDASGKPVEPKAPVKVEITISEKAEHTGDVQIVHQHADEGMVAVGDVEAKTEEGSSVSAMFEADSFSVYGIVYTVDFHYAVNGQTYEFSIPGGGYISLGQMIEMLGIENLELIPVETPVYTLMESGDGEILLDEEEREVQSTFMDDQTYTTEFITVSEATKKFVAEVASVEFSNPNLLWVGKAEEAITVGAMKEINGLNVRYSADLTQSQIAAINAQTVEAGDWALISMQPFDTEETLTIIMKNGDQWRVKVTDAQDVAATTELNVNHSYVIAYFDGILYHVLKTDGTEETFTSTSNFDKLGSDYQWVFYYVFTEKDRLGTLDYSYYFIRPIAKKTHTLALNEVGDENGLVQYGTNNIAVLPQEEGGFIFLGYNYTAEKHIELGYHEGAFAAFNDEHFSDEEAEHTILQIYQQEPLTTYEFTVVSDDYIMGSVSTTGTILTKEAPIEQYQNGSYSVVNGTVNYYISETGTNKRNAYQIKAVQGTHMNGRQNKWVFDYWDLDGVVLDRTTYGDTIQPGTLEIPRNGSVLTAHFKQNEAYTVPDNEKQGTTIESMREWLNELKNQSTPLSSEDTQKTAEVYDYENRIYRVDLTTKSNFQTFDGIIDLGFMLDVSGSMMFPSYLYDSDDVANHAAKQVSTINTNVWSNGRWTTNGEAWGLKTNKTYYIITDPAGTATVCYLYYYNNQWWLCDASKDRYNYNANGPFDPNSGISAYGNQNYGNSYYSTSASYVIQEAGDLVTEQDIADPTSNYYLTKLSLSIDDPKTRAYYLEKSLNGTINELNEILSILAVASSNASNPDVKIAWNTFRNFLPNGAGQLQHDFVSASSGIDLSYDKNTTYGGGTSTDAAILDAAGYNRNDIRDRYSDDDRKNWDTNNNVSHTYRYDYNSGFHWENSAVKYAVLITDGAPQRSGNSINTRYVKEAADLLKGLGIKLITVGLGIDDVISGKTLLYDIADTISGEKMFYSAKTGDELEDVLMQIVDMVLSDATVIGTVTDTVGTAFYPVDKATGTPLVVGNKIDLDGNKLPDNYTGPDPFGIVGEEGQIIWSNQEFTHEGWHGTVYLKAKEDLIGGNAVQTNFGMAEIVAEGYYTTDSDDVIPFNENLDEKLKTRVIDDLPTPRVNVNELGFTGNATDWTVYLGTEVDPKEQLKKIWDNMQIELVVTNAEDTDEDGLPDTMIGNPYYPVTESIADDREAEAEQIENNKKKTFPMSALIQDLAEKAEAGGASFAWWDYEKNEPKWNEFFAQALSESGIVIPYDAYELNDNSTITIRLTKDILDGEEEDLINHSPHDTTVLNHTIEDEEGNPIDVPVESYSFTIVYSPDYTVLPVGQGGNGGYDFHTGTYGTLYQGHAAGTETSQNTHTINVFAEPLDVLKIDDYEIPVSGAEFGLYRLAKEGEAGVSLSAYDPSLTGSYYCISTATSGEDGVVHLAPSDTTTPTHTIPVAGGQAAQNLLVPLPEGEVYYLIETQVPVGYKGDGIVRTIRVEAGPDFYTELDGETPIVAEFDVETWEPVINPDTGLPYIDPETGRPTMAYNWNQGVRFHVGELGKAGEQPAKMGNHATHEKLELYQNGTEPVQGEEVRTYMLRSDSEYLAVFRITILNGVIVDIQIQKVDERGNGLSGAVFVLKSLDADGHGESEVTDVAGIGTVTKTIYGKEVTFKSAFESNGTAQTLTGLPDGTYRLYEEYVPDGYISTFRYIQFTIHNRVIDPSSIQVINGNESVYTFTGATEASEGSTATLALFQVKNTPGSALPSTGGPGTNSLYLFGLVLIGFSGSGFVVTRRRRKAV